MKIRIDFVTNSSSSSFVAWLELSFDNGKELRLLGPEESNGGGNEDSVLETPDTHYDIGYDLNGSILREAARVNFQELVSLLEKLICTDRTSRILFGKEKEDILRGATRLQSAQLTLWSHTFGEYYNDADPKNMLRRFDIFDFPDFSAPDDYHQVYQELRKHPDSKYYTDDSLQIIAKALTAKWDDHGNDTEITQELTADGLIDVDIETGNGGIVPLDDLVSSFGNRTNVSPQYNLKKRLAKYGLTKADIWKDIKELAKKYNSILDESTPIQFEGKTFYINRLDYYLYEADKKISKLGGFYSNTFDSSPDYFVFSMNQDTELEDYDEVYDDLSNAIAFCEHNPSTIIISSKRLSEAIQEHRKLYSQLLYDQILDKDVPIVFQGKHFVFDCLSYFPSRDEKYIDIVKSRGGIIHTDAVKSADYLVLGSGLFWDYTYKIKQTLVWRQKGSKVKIVSLSSVINVLENASLLHEMEQRLADEEQARIEETQRKEQEEKRLREEAKQQAQEEKRRQQEEKKQQDAAEKAKLEELKQQRIAQKKQEDARRAAEIRAQKDKERAEALKNATILYAPGQEPEKLHNRIMTLLTKLESAYPDHKISGLNKNHKKWGETVTELYRKLGYPDNRSFLEAYGFAIVESDGGHPTTTDPQAIMATLQQRYPNGSGLSTLDALRTANPDIPWKTLANNSREYFGMTLNAYLNACGFFNVIGTPVNLLPISRPGNETYEVINTTQPKEEIKPSSETSFESTTPESTEKEHSVEPINEAASTNQAVTTSVSPKFPNAKEQNEGKEKEQTKYNANNQLKTAVSQTLSECVGKNESQVKEAAKSATSLSPDALFLRNPKSIREKESYHDTTLKHVVIPEGVIEIEKDAFMISSLETVVIPKSVRTIGASAFANCNRLYKVEILDGLEKIDMQAFGSCANLVDVYLPDSIKEVHTYAFADDMIAPSSHLSVHLSGNLAARLCDSAKHDTVPPFYAKEYVIDGVTYQDLNDYINKRLQEEKAAHEVEEHNRLEQLRRTREEAERRAQEIRNKALRNEIHAEIDKLTLEMNSVKGLFAGSKRKKIQVQIDELNERLRRI